MNYPKYRKGGQEKIIEMKDRHYNESGLPLEKTFIDTDYGRTCVNISGNPDGKPMLIMMGNGTTSAYVFRIVTYFYGGYKLYIPDIIGQAGESEAGRIPAGDYEYGYGKWTAQLVEGLKLDKPVIYGASFGGGVAVNSVCYAPGLYSFGVFHMPVSIIKVDLGAVWRDGLRNDFGKRIHSRKILDDYITKRCSVNGVIDPALLEENGIVGVESYICNDLPGLVRHEDMYKCQTQCIAALGELDPVLPLAKIKGTIEQNFPSCRIHVMKGRGHSPYIDEEGINAIMKLLGE